MRVSAIASQNHLVKIQNLNKTQIKNTQNQNQQLMDLSSSSALKNQILFKGNFKKADVITPHPMRSFDLYKFQDDLGIVVGNENLLHQALIHHGVVDSIDEISTPNYDNRRLAAVGENALRASVTKMIFEKAPYAEAKTINDISKEVLSQENLVEKAHEIGLDKLLMVDIDYFRGRTPKKPYAEAFQAVAGAMMLGDETYGYDNVCKLVEKTLQKDMDGTKKISGACRRKSPCTSARVQSTAAQTPQKNTTTESITDGTGTSIMIF